MLIWTSFRSEPSRREELGYSSISPAQDERESSTADSRQFLIR